MATASNKDGDASPAAAFQLVLTKQSSSESSYEPMQETSFGSANNKKMARVSKKLQQRVSGYPYDLKQKRKLRKNNREKQRRSELNVKFEKLCTLLGRQAKAEKYTILTDAINLIGELRHENQELKMEKIGLRNELVNASVGPGVTEADLEKALLAAFPDAPALPPDLSPPGSPSEGSRHLASSDDSEDDDVGVIERGDRGLDSYSSKLDGVAALSMGGSPSIKTGQESSFFPSPSLPSSHLSLSGLSNLLYKQSPSFLHPQTFPPFPSSFGPSFASQYNPVMNFHHNMMPLSLPLDPLENMPSMPPLPDLNPPSHMPSHLNTLTFPPSRSFASYPNHPDVGQPSFSMDQREDSHGNTFLSF